MSEKPIVKATVFEEKKIEKAETETQLDVNKENTASEWISQPVDLKGLKALVNNSTILPQCIKAYKNNIAGYGIGIRYKDDYEEETDEMKTEWEQIKKIIDLFSFDCDAKVIFENVVEAKETYGIAYVEVIRNIKNEVAELAFVKNTPTIMKSVESDSLVETKVNHNGEEIKRLKRFCKYKQTIGTQTVYFKEFGDPRIMNRETGEYSNLQEDESSIVAEADKANEIIEFANGVMPYGEVRWIGQILNVSGSRSAENLNNNYFINGRHTPMLISVQGGTLSDESKSNLQNYMDNIRGEAGQHKFLLLEIEGAKDKAFEGEKQPTVEVKDLANILQKDELFQEYLDNSRRKVQSAFQLPDLYVAYTTEYNRATAQTAVEVTEKQVFIPERRSLEWTINNKLLNEFNFKYCEVYFLAPDITNPDDLSKILTIAEKAGGVTPNMAKNMVFEATGKTADDYDEPWGDIPIALTANRKDTAEQLEQQIQKAYSNNENGEVIAIMKEVRRLLIEQGE